MRFVPMYFRCTCVAVVQFHRGNTLELSPSTNTILLPETHNIVDVDANCDNFNFLYSPYNLEIHSLFS